MNSLSYRLQLWPLVFLLMAGLCADVVTADDAILVTADDVTGVHVEEVSRKQIDSQQTPSGLLIWSENGIEQWMWLTEGMDVDHHSGNAFDLKQTSRSNGEQVSTGMQVTGLGRLSLDQLLGRPVVRATGNLPIRIRSLNGKPAFRRQALKGDVPFPADRLTISRPGQPPLIVAFPKGASAVAWSSLKEVPKEHANGLAAGLWQVRFGGSKSVTTLTVETAEERDWILQRPAALAKLFKGERSPVYKLVTAEHLIGMTDVEGEATPFLNDALDLLESIPNVPQGSGLERLTDSIRARLFGDKSETGDADPENPSPMNAVRELIAAGQWSDAEAKLHAMMKGDLTQLERGRIWLYLATIASEGGVAMPAVQQADRYFSNAVTDLAEGTDADQYRVSVNYANYLVGQAQDGLYNRAFQSATGVEAPLQTALQRIQVASNLYANAFRFASDDDELSPFAIRVNEARMLQMMADLMRTLTTTENASEQQNAIAKYEQLAVALAIDAATQPGALADVRASAREVLAHIAFRQGDGPEARKQTMLAIESHLEAGSLAGLEAGFRTLGMCQLRASQFRKPFEPAGDPLRSLMTSQLITELLRERFPAGQASVAQTGFFARRAYVNELIVSLLAERGDAVEALRFAELAKSRSLSDLLALRGLRAGQQAAPPAELEEILEQWPDDVVAVEYFMTPRGVWIFTIDDGDVHCELLKSEEGTAVSSPALVADVTGFLSTMSGVARKMLSTYRSTGSFDHSWQTELHRYYKLLLPKHTRERIEANPNVVVIPHHVLHYFPFAALVTKVDSNNVTGLATVLPRFLIEDGVNLTTSPSLTTWSQLRTLSDQPMRKASIIGITEFAMAPALPGVEVDLKNLKTHFGGRIGKEIAGKDATEPNCLSAFDQRGMLFVATHGMNVADKPLDSFLLCHASKSSDGRLTSAEIFDRRIESELVVMSACYTGLADRTPLPGDDLFGLQRAMLASGANTVISGLWDVYDGSGPIVMERFLARLSAGEAASASLSGAQRDFLKQQREKGKTALWVHPYFWAVYNSAGSDMTRMRKNP